MINQQHSITLPSEELRRQWQSECPFVVISVKREDYMIDRAAQWGADQELKACCEWLKLEGHEHEHVELREARRPKPPSLKKQALDAYSALRYGPDGDRSETQDWNTLRRALESIND